METKTILKDPSLLVPQIFESGQVESDVRHRAKLSGVKDIQQSMVGSSPDAMTKFGQTQVETQVSAYLEEAQAIAAGADTTIVLPTQVLKGLNYAIPKKYQLRKIMTRRRKMMTRKRM